KDDRLDVLEFDEKWERDRWTIFICRPEPNVLLCATTRGYLLSVLRRIRWNSKSPPAERRPYLELPEWKLVDSNARFWSIRHYDPGNATHDPTTPFAAERRPAINPDSQAIGLTYSYDPASGKLAKVKYLSANPERMAIAKRYWGRAVPEKEPTFQQTAPNVVEV